MLLSTSLSALTVDFDGLSVYYGDIPNTNDITSHPIYQTREYNFDNNRFDLSGTLEFSQQSGNFNDNLLDVDLYTRLINEDDQSLSYVHNFTSAYDGGLTIYGEDYFGNGFYSLNNHFNNNLVVSTNINDPFQWGALSEGGTLYFYTHLNPDQTEFLIVMESVTYTSYNVNQSFALINSESITDSSNMSTIHYVFNVVPEPSTYALIIGGLVLGFVALRRK